MIPCRANVPAIASGDKSGADTALRLVARLALRLARSERRTLWIVVRVSERLQYRLAITASAGKFPRVQGSCFEHGYLAASTAKDP